MEGQAIAGKHQNIFGRKDVASKHQLCSIVVLHVEDRTVVMAAFDESEAIALS